MVPTYSAAAVCKAFSWGQPVDQAVMFAPTLNHLEDKGEICLSNILLLSFSDLFFWMVLFEYESVPQGLICVDTWPPANGTVWKGCGTFRRSSLGRGSPLLGAGFNVHSWLHCQALSALCTGMQCDRLASCSYLFPCLHQDVLLAWWPEFHPQNLHKWGRKEVISQSCF